MIKFPSLPSRITRYFSAIRTAFELITAIPIIILISIFGILFIIASWFLLLIFELPRIIGKSVGLKDSLKMIMFRIYDKEHIRDLRNSFVMKFQERLMVQVDDVELPPEDEVVENMDRSRDKVISDIRNGELTFSILGGFGALIITQYSDFIFEGTR